MAKSKESSKAKNKPFTDAGIQKLKATGKRLEVSEPGGLRMMVGKRTKVWIYRYQKPRGLDTSTKLEYAKLTIGRYPEMGLKEARTARDDAQDMIDRGIDPAQVKQEKIIERLEEITIKDLVEEYLAKAKTKKKSWKEDKGYLDREIVERFGGWKASMVKRQDLLKMLDEIVDRGKPVAANRTLGIAKLLFKHAVYYGHIEHNPTTDLEPPTKEKAKDRVLSDKEIQVFWQDVEGFKCRATVKIVLKLILVTAQRVGEVRQMRWDQIDGTWWTIPATIAKNGKSHRVPLSTLALGLLAEAKELKKKSDFVFPGNSVDAALTKDSVPRALARNIERLGREKYASHDLRRTASSRMASIGIDEAIVDRILNHSQKGVIAVYNRYGYDTEKRNALNLWADALGAIIAGQVLPTFEGDLDSFRIEYEAGDKMAMLRAVQLSMKAGRVPPDWARKIFLEGLEGITSGKNEKFFPKP